MPPALNCFVKPSPCPKADIIALNMAIIFDGRDFARSKEEKLKKDIFHLKEKGITPKMVSILVGEDPASVLYVNLKRKAAERIGAILEVKRFGSEVEKGKLMDEIKSLNKNKLVHGIMVQLPLPGGLRAHTKEILETIDSNKDVDGLKEKGFFLHATAKAIVQIIKLANADISKKVCVIGTEGMVGRSLVRELRRLGYPMEEKSQNADILITATGKAGLIKGDMVKAGAVVIDVGSPKGDVDFESVSKKAAFITPVPGGVGPVTIVSLLDNLLIAAKNLLK